MFTELCRRHDGCEWDIRPLCDALENEIAVESERNRQVIHLAMEAQLSGRLFDFSITAEERERAQAYAREQLAKLRALLNRGK